MALSGVPPRADLQWSGGCGLGLLWVVLMLLAVRWG